MKEANGTKMAKEIAKWLEETSERMPDVRFIISHSVPGPAMFNVDMNAILLNPEAIAHTIVGVAQVYPEAEWERIVDYMVEHELGHREFFLSCRCSVEVGVEELARSLVEDVLIDSKLRGKYPDVFEGMNRYFRAIPRDRIKKGLKARDLDAVGLAVITYNAEELRRHFPKYPELAGVREIMDGVKDINDLPRAYQQIKKKLHRYEMATR